MRHLHIDIETRSGLDLAKVGAYRYAEDAIILMAAWAIGDSRVKVVDCVGAGCPAELRDLLIDPSVLKVAHNAAFERTLIQACWGIECPPEQWQCTMVTAYANGLPGTLAEVSHILAPETKKDAAGKKLIRLFSLPQKPTKRQPKVWLGKEDRPDEWAQFLSYCAQDVEAERAIHAKLKPLPDREWALWHIDQRANDLGIKIDQRLVEMAIRIDDQQTADLTDEAIRLTGLDNPNSVAQLKEWLEAAHDERVDSLNKESLKELSERLNGNAQRVIEIRQQLGKTSVNKYRAMDRSVCADGRVRGLLQFYGAARTGRWSGRLIQVQNLPKSRIEDVAELDAARDAVLLGDLELLKLIYGNPTQILSDLIRTALVAEEGRRLIVCDESAIEARVLAWLADEKWRLDVFATHGKIYEASAAAMFKVPLAKIKKGNPEYALRQKGKVAELACIAEGQLVLTDGGLVPIENVTREMRVWDGVEFVSHEGLVFRGIKNVISYDGLTATKDHIVFTAKGERLFGEAAESGLHILRSGSGGRALRVGGDSEPGAALFAWLACAIRTNPLYWVFGNTLATSGQPHKREIEGLPILLKSAAYSSLARQEAYCGEAALLQPSRPWFQKLRGAWHQVRLWIGDGSWPVVDRKLWATESRDGGRQDRRQRPLRAGESSVGDARRELSESATCSASGLVGRGMALRENRCPPHVGKGANAGRNIREREAGGAREAQELAGHSRQARVYDILNCGPRNRFTVSDCLVHNCGYGGGINALIAMGAVRMGLPEADLQPIIDAWRAANPRIVKLWSVVEADAKAAIRECREVKRKRWSFSYGEDKVLRMHLPSGRALSYYNASIKGGRIEFDGIDGMSKRWSRLNTYSGKLVENMTQALARDCMAEAMLRCRDAGYQICMTVHDELVIEAPVGFGSVAEVERLMGEEISWAPGLPLKGAGFESTYYRKD